MNFKSDNCAGAHPKITENLAANASGFAASYGASDVDRRAEEMFCDLFGRQVAVFFVGTGTAANALAMTAVNRPGGVVFCHPQAHIFEDECGAPEYFTGGARLAGVDGAFGRMDPDGLVEAIGRHPADFVHNGQPMAVSITQSTEIGTLYAPGDIDAISTIGRKNGLPLHMDGARFANALVALDLTPAAMTVERGVDIVSFGGTKNGCWCAEALVFLDPDMAADVPFLRKRAAHLFSKSRFIAAQFEAYLADGLWLELARHSNAMATALAEGLAASSNCRLAWQPEANEVFPVIKRQTAARLVDAGAEFHEWPMPSFGGEKLGDDEMLCRLVTSFATTEEDVARFCEIAG
ncbi:MAG: low specificity L-threonine aldolase [Rhizobiaceae bacterium]